jgi:hypothetical protein
MAAALGLAALLAACGGGGDTSGGNPRVPPDGSDDYQTAYLRGCDSGFEDSGWQGYVDKWSRDEDSFKKVPDYRKGWIDGYKACYAYGLKRPQPTVPAGH